MPRPCSPWKRLSTPALTKALSVIVQDQWIENSVGMIINLNHAGTPKTLAVKAEPPGLGPRDQPSLCAPVLATNAPHDSYESSIRNLHIRRKCSREADETEQEAVQGSVQDSQVITRSMTLQCTAVQGHESFRLIPDMQTTAKNETARHVRPSAGQLQPSTLMEWKQDSKSSQDFGDCKTMMHELQRASTKRTFVRI